MSTILDNLRLAVQSGSVSDAEAALEGQTSSQIVGILNQPFDDGPYPNMIWYAIWAGHEALVRYILSARIAAGVDPHGAINASGKSPLHVAAYYDRSDMARMLIAERADLNRAETRFG